MRSGMLSGVLSDTLLWHIYLAYLLTFFLAFYLVYLWRFFVVEVWRGTLRSGACGGGPAGITVAVRVRQDDFDPEVAARVRRGTLRSRTCS